MGLKRALKRAVIGRVLKKRRDADTFDSAASELYELPKDATWDVNNSYYFSANGSDGVSLFFRLAYRGGGRVEAWLAYYDKNTGKAFFNTPDVFGAEDNPAFVRCVTPLREWRFGFKGKVKRAEPDANLIARPKGGQIDAEFTGVFKASENDKLYEFSRDSDVCVLADAISAEKWVKGFSDELNKNHQIHTEQGGHIKGDLKIGDKVYRVDSPALRDHSFGRRDWGYMNRHIWLVTRLNDGALTCANAVRYPALNTVGLKSGYYMKGGAISNVTDTLDIDKFGDSGTPVPRTARYVTRLADKSAAGKKVLPSGYNLEIAFPFLFKDGEYIIYEGISEYDIGGIKGRGITEFGYNADETRWRGRR